ncbi:Uncharacterised protein [Sphingobacterium multivorum]|uniref:Uncharacterized protein n=1 Tax=Sphingobacterium multivorum TaxID=28454 RepID=A0A2X2IQF4_SPHMU|nr:hypothetical protein [Sphingobacterium multivorum]SPZ84228.1 Uncharacterised protein [Sphingobacterium multivorum]
MKHLIRLVFLLLFFQQIAQASERLRVAVAGLNHDHVFLLLNLYKDKKSILSVLPNRIKPYQTKYERSIIYLTQSSTMTYPVY